MYTNDLNLLAENGEDLQCLLVELSTWCNIWGVKINAELDLPLYHVRPGFKMATTGEKFVETCN